ncbi:MAG TPA: response regulator [Actinomycetota bacterium]|nr:response regulator [Actinomycetota bacterium]
MTVDEMSTKILVVDDEPDVLLLCKVNLEFEGYEVAVAPDGATALEMIADDPPDLLLLDVMMPGLDGWQVLQRLRDDVEGPQFPVIMLTAKVQEQDQIKGLSGGAVDYVTKPFNPVGLAKTIQEALEAAASGDLEIRRERMLDKIKLIQG